MSESNEKETSDLAVEMLKVENSHWHSEARARRTAELFRLRERELEEQMAKLREDLREREQMFEQERQRQQRMLRDRERKFIERLEVSERRQAEAQSEIAQKEARLEAMAAELAHEKHRYLEESRKRIEANSASYVAEALESLELKERQFHLMSKIWSAIGAGGLLVALGLLVYLSLASWLKLPTVMSWPLFTFTVVKGLVVVTLIAALTRYAFLFSTRYMHEALKNADRRHAINFGKFYLQSYGAAADWTQVKDAFEHWNISAANAFTKQGPEGLPDLSVIERAAEVIEKATKMLPSVGSPVGK